MAWISETLYVVKNLLSDWWYGHKDTLGSIWWNIQLIWMHRNDPPKIDRRKGPRTTTQKANMRKAQARRRKHEKSIRKAQTGRVYKP
jgi:hypothetical protein